MSWTVHKIAPVVAMQKKILIRLCGYPGMQHTAGPRVPKMFSANAFTGIYLDTLDLKYGGLVKVQWCTDLGAMTRGLLAWRS
jgi:hypothetical protein